MNRIIVTGANGVGKTRFARELAQARPGIPVVSFDSLKLQTDWHQRPRSETDADLSMELEKNAWILEGGPSLLPNGIEKADALVWLDPAERVRVWRLLIRPWKYFGMTRPELPPGNVDWPLQQYRFALRSISRRSHFRAYISEMFENAEGLQKWRCRQSRDCAAVVARWRQAGAKHGK